MKKRGFTLIELLAVIVILAIIALIATPIILNVVNNSRKSSAVDSAYGYIDSIEYQNQMNALDNVKYPGIPNGEDIEVEDINVQVKGKAPDGGTVTIEGGKVSSALLCINGYNVEYTPNKAEVKNRCNASVKLLQKINPMNTTSTLDSIEIPINATAGTTVTATAVDEQNNEVTGVVENGVVRFSGLRAGKNYRYTIIATDSNGNSTTRQGNITTVSFNHITISEDTSNWTQKKTITITTAENPTGTTLQYKVGSGNWTNYTEPFDVNENTTVYARLVNGENISDEESFTITTVDNVTLPIPTATVTTGGFPTITSSGVVISTSGTLSISYTAQTGTSAYYSVDGGNTWTLYSGQTQVSTTSVKVKLKRDVSGIEGNVVDATSTSGNSGTPVGANAYDNDLNSYYELYNGNKSRNECRINIDSSMWNRLLHVKFTQSNGSSCASDGWYQGYFYIYSSSSTEPLLSGRTTGACRDTSYDNNITVPENADYMVFHPQWVNDDQSFRLRVYDVRPVTQ